MQFQTNDKRALFLYSLGGLNGFIKKSSELLGSTQRKASLFAIDLSGFTPVWKEQGFLKARSLLDSVAQRLSKLSPSNGVFFWLEGSDEFYLFVPEVEEKEFCKKILSQFKTTFKFDDMEAQLSAKIGIATFPKDGRSGQELIQKAHLATINQSAEKT